MRYAELADIYEQLERTPAKLGKTAIIAKLFKKAPAKRLPRLVLLLMGRVFPAWSAEEIGVAGKLMTKAIAAAVSQTEAAVTRKFTETGDLGQTAEFFVMRRRQRALGRKALTVDDVFDTVRKVARQTGPGSTERKLKLIAGLLVRAGPKEARYVVRTILEELRVGVAEGMIRDAIAAAFHIPTRKVEDAWFLHPDYGKIAKVVKERGEAGLKAIKLELGMPIMVLLAEKAPDLKTAIESFRHCVLEFKYDGMRANIHKKGDKIWIYTRRLEDVTSAFPDLVEFCREGILAKEAIVDGEALAIDKKTGRPLPFQMLSTRIKRKYRIKEVIKEIPVQLHVFDIIYLEGKMLFDLRLAERIKLLRKVIRPIPGKLLFAEQLVTKDLKTADTFYRKALAAGQEGLIVKNLDARYMPGRRIAGGWLKVKPVMETLDLAIIGATWGTGKRAGWLGSFILGCRDPATGKFLECGMLGTGIKEKKTKPTDVTFADMTKALRPHIISEKTGVVKIKPKITVEVAYEEIQKSPTYTSGWALRFPRFIRLRTLEKPPQQADTKQRIEHLYQIQKGKKPRR